MYSKRNQRRHFIKMAASGLALPLFGTSGNNMFAQTNSGKAPLRFLTLIDTYGVPENVRDKIWLSSANGDYALQEAHLGTILEPLKAYRENMLLVSGVEDLSSVHGGGHHNIIKTLSGSRAFGQGDAGAKLKHPSLDVAIGNYLNSDDYGLASRRAYSHLSFCDYAEPSFSTFSFDASGNEIRPLAGAKTAATALFGKGTVSTVGASQSAKINAERYVLDLVSEKVRSLKALMGSQTHTAFMEAYEDSVHDLSSQLETRLGNVCSAPNSYENYSESRYPKNAGFNQRYQMFETFTQLFSCDMTASIAYNFGSESFNALGYGDLYDNDYQDDYLKFLLSSNYHQPSHGDDEQSNKTHELVRHDQASLLAKFLDTMSQTPDVDGNMVLDNMIVYLTSPLSHNTHRTSNFVLAIIAGKNTNLHGGYHYDCTGNTINDVLATVAQGATLSVDGFGGYDGDGRLDARHNNGPIARMLKATV